MVMHRNGVCMFANLTFATVSARYSKRSSLSPRSIKKRDSHHWVSISLVFPRNSRVSAFRDGRLGTNRKSNMVAEDRGQLITTNYHELLDKKTAQN